MTGSRGKSERPCPSRPCRMRSSSTGFLQAIRAAKPRPCRTYRLTAIPVYRTQAKAFSLDAALRDAILFNRIPANIRCQAASLQPAVSRPSRSTGRRRRPGPASQICYQAASLQPLAAKKVRPPICQEMAEGRAGGGTSIR